AGTGGNQLADDDVFLQAQERVDLALDRGLGQHPGRLLERRGRQEAFGGQRRLGDTEKDGLGYRRFAAPLDHALVLVLELEQVDDTTGQQLGIARAFHTDLAQHLPHDQLDVLIVDVYALVPVDLLHLLNQVLLDAPHALHLQDVVRVDGAFRQAVARFYLGAVPHLKPRAVRDSVGFLLSRFSRDDDLPRALRLDDAAHAVYFRD